MSENKITTFQFNAEQVKPDAGRPLPIAKGDYLMVMTGGEVKPTSSGTGAYIAGEFKVFSGPHQGHLVFHNFNIRNQSEKAQEIGYGQLSALCHAVGVLNIIDISQLFNRPFTGTLKIGGGGKNPDTGEEYEQRNEITAFKKQAVSDTNVGIV